MGRFTGLFDESWPRYAILAHVLFWAMSALFITSIVAGIVGLVSAAIPVSCFVLWLVAAGVLGLAALCSGKLYAGNQIFSRTPLTGVSARIAGGFVLAGTAALILFGYAVTTIRGG